MNADDYLARLRRQLKGFPPDQQDEILAEIAAHLEDGAADPAFGEARVLAEMGAPGDMGSGFHSVYRPNRWLDFVLIFAPIYLFYPQLNTFYRWFTGDAMYQDEAGLYAFSIRAVIVLGLVMAMIAVQRRSLLLFAFWVPDVITRLINLMTQRSRWQPDLASARAALLETLLACALLLGLSYWLARTLWKNRSNLLIVLFALQPLIGMLLGYLTTRYSQAWSIAPNYPVWIIGGFGVQNVLEVASLAGFVLLRPRDLRWAAFLLGTAYYSAFMFATYWPNPLPLALWALYPGVLLLFWALDLRQRAHFAV